MHIEDRSGEALREPAGQGDRRQDGWSTGQRAVDAKTDADFVVMARTDALAVEGLEAAIERAVACVEAGADMIFPEAITDLSMYKRFADAVKVPILANITEFGSTPLYTVDELRGANVATRYIRCSLFAR